MNIRFFLFVVTFLVVGIRSFAAERPNFVWLISEDNSKHFLKLFDETGAATPNIAALAKEGLLFEHAFSNGPVCSVARTTLMTSCYGPRIGTQYHRRTFMAPMPDGLRMFPAYLRQAGYYSTNNRKKDYNAQEGRGVWDESSNKATWRNRSAGQSFFHMQSFGASHESSLHFHPSKMQNEVTKTDPKSVFIPPCHPDTPTFRYTYARYHDRIQDIDQQIADVVQQIENDGLLEDTFIFYFGDHGGVLPGSKGYANERGLHVPLVVRVPKNFHSLVSQQIGSRVSTFVSFIDFGPTLLHLAGLDVPKQVDGKAFLGTGITDERMKERDTAFGYADRFDEKYDFVRTLRKGRFQYVRNYQPFNFDGLQNNYRYRMLAYQEWRNLFDEGKLNEHQRAFFLPRKSESLFDVVADPYETKDLSGDQQFATTLKDMRERLREHVKAMPDLSFIPESDLFTNAASDPTGFGRQYQGKIAKLVDIADLSLQPFKQVREKLVQSLSSESAWERYWAAIACSTHGSKASSLAPSIATMAKSDSNNLVRVRAAEFLGLTNLGDPRETILDALKQSQNKVEANLILNTLVLLRDGQHQWQFDIADPRITNLNRFSAEVERRLLYLTDRLER